MNCKDQEYADKLVQHFDKYFGIKGTRLSWSDGPIDKLNSGFSIVEYAPNKRHNMWAYCTIGMSLNREDNNLAELLIYSPKADNSLVELLTLCASFHKNNSAINLNHTINIGRSWLDNSICDRGFISLPYLDGDELELFTFQEKTVHCYWLIPITEKEQEYKINYGTEALEQLFEVTQIDYLNPDRQSLI